MYSSPHLQERNTIHIQSPTKTKASNLNASLNEGLRYCNGEYVVLYQDFIELEPEAIEKMLTIASAVDKALVTSCTRNPKGEIEDPRYLGVDAVRPCLPEEWEANFAIAPLDVFYELGGFDEEYDNGWSWDNVNLAQRAEMLGYHFLLDETNRPQLLHHEKEPDSTPRNGEFHEANMRKIRAGEKPLKCDYLW